MNILSHCVLCDHQILSLKEGTTCALTNKKPDFFKSCPKISLNEKFEEKLKTINIKYERIMKTKTPTIVHLVVFILIGLAFIAGGYYLNTRANEGNMFSTLPFIVMGIGVFMFLYATAPLNKYRREISVAQSNKDNMEQILSIYNIQYSIDLKFEKEIHGTQEVKAKLSLSRKS